MLTAILLMKRYRTSFSWVGQSNWSPILNPSYDVYEVQRGATLSVIAKAYDVTVDDIKKANNLNGGTELHGTDAGNAFCLCQGFRPD